MSLEEAEEAKEVEEVEEKTSFEIEREGGALVKSMRL